MNIKQNANRAASRAGAPNCWNFSRKQRFGPEVQNLTDVLADLRMLLARLSGNEITLTIEHGWRSWPVKVDIGPFRAGHRQHCRQRPRTPAEGRRALHASAMRGRGMFVHRHRELPEADYVLIEIADTRPKKTGIGARRAGQDLEPFFNHQGCRQGQRGLGPLHGPLRIIKQTGG